MAADSNSANKAKGTLAIMEGCAVIGALDKAASQRFSDLRGKVVKKTDQSITYESKQTFPNSYTQIVEYADGNTSGYIGMGSGKTDEAHRKFYDGIVELVQTCVASKIVNSHKNMSNKHSLNTIYILSNNACVDVAGINFFGQKMITINFWTPDSAKEKCDALRAAVGPGATETPAGDDRAAAREKADDPAETAIRDAYETGKAAFDARDYEAAKANLEKAAEGGLAEAQIVLARMYLEETYLDRSEGQARYWLQKAMDQGNLEAQARLGSLLINAEQIPADAQLGYRLIRTAANAGSAEGQYRLGILYMKGQAGLAKSEAEAVRLWKLAVAQGHIGAHTNLGWAYIWGETTPHDYEEGYRLTAIAAENENAQAQNNMGAIYAYGIGVEEDDSAALDWYVGACTNRHSGACVTVGDFYENGWAGPKDPKQAVKAYELAWAIDGDNADALFGLGWAYYSGAGVRQDYSEALYYFNTASRLGHDQAIINLGSMYNNGQGVEENNSKAAAIFLIGALRGDARAAHFAATMLISNDLQYELWKSRSAKPTARMAKLAKEMTLWALENGLEEEYRAQARRDLKWTNMFLGVVGFSVAHLPNLWDKYQAGKPDEWDWNTHWSYVTKDVFPQLLEN